MVVGALLSTCTYSAGARLTQPEESPGQATFTPVVVDAADRHRGPVLSSCVVLDVTSGGNDALGSGDGPLSGARVNGEYPPSVLDSFQLVDAPIVEVDVGPGNQVSDRP